MPATTITYQASGLTMNCLFLPVTNKQQPDWLLLTIKKKLLRNPDQGAAHLVMSK